MLIMCSMKGKICNNMSRNHCCGKVAIHYNKYFFRKQNTSFKLQNIKYIMLLEQVQGFRMVHFLGHLLVFILKVLKSFPHMVMIQKNHQFIKSCLFAICLQQIRFQYDVSNRMSCLQTCCSKMVSYGLVGDSMQSGYLEYS